MGKTDSIIMGLFSGVAQGFGRRAFEERQRKERKEGQFTPLQKAQLDSFQSIINDPLQSVKARVAAKKGANELIGVETSESKISQNITSKAGREGEDRTFKLEQQGILNLKSQAQLKTAETQGVRAEAGIVQDALVTKQRILTLQNQVKNGNAQEKRAAQADIKLEQAELKIQADGIKENIKTLLAQQKTITKTNILSSSGAQIPDRSNPEWRAIQQNINELRSTLLEVTGTEDTGKKLIPGF